MGRMGKPVIFERVPWLALLALRLAIGVGFIYHASFDSTRGAKIPLGSFGEFDAGHAWVTRMSEAGIAPAPLLYLAAWTELLGGLAVLLGLFTRWGALGLCGMMAYAIFFVHLGSSFSDLELSFLYGAGCLTLLVFGGGSISLDHLLFEKRRESA